MWASSIRTTSSAKTSHAIACSSSVHFPTISVIFGARFYKFRRQFRWYLVSCATMSPVFSCVKRYMSSRIGTHYLKRESSWNVAALWRPKLPGASLQKKHFTCWCFVLVLDGHDRYRVCLRTTTSYALSASIFRCLFSTLPNLVLLYLNLHILWYPALLALNAASTPLLSSNWLNKKELWSNPSSLNLLRCPARML